MTKDHQLCFKPLLQSLGALRPEAWERIVQLCQQTSLKPNESLIREPGSLAYVANGLLKEYDAQQRKSPSIINFIGHKQSLITRKYNQNLYLKAAMPSLVYYWNFNDLQQLYGEFAELKAIYDNLCAAYDEISAYRQLVLEEHYTKNRIMLFMVKHKELLPLLKKKDMANYVQINYNHFIKAYNLLL